MPPLDFLCRIDAEYAVRMKRMQFAQDRVQTAARQRHKRMGELAIGKTAIEILDPVGHRLPLLGTFAPSTRSEELGPDDLLAANAALMLKSHIGWDKYALALLIVLWWLQAERGSGTLDLCPRGEACNPSSSRS